MSRTQVRAWVGNTLRGGNGYLGAIARGAMWPASRVLEASVRSSAKRVARTRTPIAETFIVSVGGLTIGGVGKTPLVAAIARLLATEHAVAVVSRGYGSAFARASVRRVSPDDDARLVGDEPLALARTLGPMAHVVVARDRVRGVQAARACGATCIVVDDAFQTWSCPRDVDVVAVDARRPGGTGQLVPAGDLREPPAALARAQIVIVTRVDRAGDAQRAATRDWVARHAPDALVAETHHRTSVWAGTVPRGCRVWIACGVADPASVCDGVRGIGAEIVGQTCAPDHHVWSAEEWHAITARARAAGAGRVVVTDKDAARITGEQRAALGIDVAVVGAEIEWLTSGDLVRAYLLAGARRDSRRPL